MMARHRDQLRALNRAGIDGARIASARSCLTEAVTELQRLTQGPLFSAMPRVLADLDNAPHGSSVSVETVRMLRKCSAEHLRIADELEVAARRCRLVEEEIGQRIDALLAGWERQAYAARQRDPVRPPAGARRRNGLEGWLREIFHRDRTGQEWPGDGSDSPAHERGSSPVTLSASRLAAPPAADGPAAEADVAALVLGPLEVRVAGEHVLRWSSLKARAVFQYLLIHQGRPVRRDALMELEWPDHTHNSARNNLNVALYSLRNTLERPRQGIQPILYRDGCYLLNPALTWWIDRNEFLSLVGRAESARRGDHRQQAADAYHDAVQLYRGPLFEDDLSGEWYLPEQRHLEELYLQALGNLAEVYCDLGELSAAVQFGQLAIDTDPCCEPVHRVLMRCYALQHQQQLVSRQYRCCVDALRDELGVLPGTETVRLFRSLTSAS